MEFRYRAGEERDHAYGGYFSEQALRAGFDVGSSGLVPLPAMSRTEALLEELREKRMREELLVREIAHERMLEEEIMRELAIERQWRARRFEEERFSPLPLEMEDRAGFGQVKRSWEIREYDRALPSLPMSRLHGDIAMDMDVRALERPPVVRKSMVGKTGLFKLLSKPESSGTKKDLLRAVRGLKIMVEFYRKKHGPIYNFRSHRVHNRLMDHQTSGVKRKAASELPRPAKKEWSCSLCHVIATSQKTLNVHLRGKKHNEKKAQLTNNKATSKKSDASSSLYQANGISANESTKKIDSGGNKQQHKPAKAGWCGLCKVKCNSAAMLDFHLKGRKHKAKLDSKKGNGAGTDTTPTAEVVKEVTDQSAKEEEVEANDNAMAADHKAGEEELNAPNDSALLDTTPGI